MNHGNTQEGFLDYGVRVVIFFLFHVVVIISKKLSVLNHPPPQTHTQVYFSSSGGRGRAETKGSPAQETGHEGTHPATHSPSFN